MRPSAVRDNLSCRNNFYLHENDNHFHIKGCAKPRFDTEAQGNSEIAYRKRDIFRVDIHHGY